MIPLNHVLSPELTFIEDFGASKKRVLQTIAERLSQTLSDHSDIAIFDQLVARERLGSTGIGSGVAVPHCRLEGLDAPVALLVRLPEAIDFDAIDRQPVDLIFTLIVPAEATDEHLQLLAGIVERVHDPDELKRLHQCPDAASLYQSFSGAAH
ncbi:PTS sugar transporter subunit IIA [Reinekea blandensis]|uniref:Nitrogen regulatory IIA protein n=1 Tax=Reinekea blandensis MED297 TaxID=314283 RepID=A4BC76_9GAMM|nr:PTS sugar transporter subunit IIA [Reinekea blandensis]EAR10142.1 nitrogen regulatory IIA protein [Reinekea sp. MED297] [Reinekea blandensis MED297]